MVGAVGILRWSAMGLLGSGVVCGSLLALDRFDADARSRDTVQLLDLLDAAAVPGGTHEINVRSSEPIRPPSKLVLSIRVGLLSRNPVQSVRASPTTTCRRPDGSFIAVNQLLEDSTESSDSSRICKGGVMDINGYSYEGSIELLRSNNAWLAVNELSLENYVASVVGA